ncbi:YdcF family protein [Lichenihabitans sp. PAMC28606]|uniref:YdcF family protein n=1 Tax=Lichenihabitans sp. PAMC28606 TaxID=2880932 RepID=UPI001D09CADD|nr:YdcF family protein [Lichenihabitans sp. PAMC28606]UDL93358.1 YdcF family protein [Lichenihabitans sp. PAMC28606]
MERNPEDDATVTAERDSPARLSRRHSRPSLLRMLSRLILLLCLCATGGLVAGFFLFVQTLDRSEPEPIHHAEGVVALTGGADRITDALELLANGNADRLLISGVNPNTSGPAIARLAPETRRLFDCCVELGYAAENTVGNALETRRWVRTHNIRSLIVVTSNYHMPRALAEIGHVVPGVELLAFPVVTERAKAGDWWVNGQRFRLVLAEYLKYVLALARLHFADAGEAGPRATSPSRTLVGAETRKANAL